jgi:hypothetical protein
MIQRKILHLPIKKKFFDMIASGEKIEEYRGYKRYWVDRLLVPSPHIHPEDWYPFEMLEEITKHRSDEYPIERIMELFDTRFARFDAIKLVNGYGNNRPSLLIECKGITIGKAKPEWSDNWQGEVFIIKLDNLINQQP